MSAYGSENVYCPECGCAVLTFVQDRDGHWTKSPCGHSGETFVTGPFLGDGTAARVTVEAPSRATPRATP